MAKKYIPNIRAGDNYLLEIKYNNGTNITGYKFWLTLKAKFTDGDALAILQATTTAGDYPTDDPLNGICYLSVASAITAGLPIGNYYFDLQAKSATDEIATLLPPIDDYRSKITVVPQVTNASV